MSSLNNDKKLFVIIVTYNPSRWIERTLSDLHRSEYPSELIIIDNASSEEELAKLKANAGSFTVIENKTNLGFGQANNQGIQVALENGADYIFLLNQDAYVYPDTFSRLIEALEENTDYGLLSPVHLAGDGQSLDYAFEAYTNVKGENIGLEEFKNSDLILQLSFINAAGWMLSRKCIEKVGLFGKPFFHYGEDRDFCNRCRAAGINVGVKGGSLLIHDRENRNAMRKPFKMIVRDYKSYSLALLCDINGSFLAQTFRTLYFIFGDPVKRFFQKADFRYLASIPIVLASTTSNLGPVAKHRTYSKHMISAN